MPAKTRWNSWSAAVGRRRLQDGRKRLVLRIVEEGAGMIKEFDAPEMEKITARWLVLNALREAARFDAALAELASARRIDFACRQER